MAKERDLADQTFSTRSFLRTLSYREFFTSLSLALLLLAFYRLLDYYSNEDWIGNNGALIKWALFCIILPLNHVFYKAEHKRQNNFVGRNLHDYILLVFLVALYKLQLFLIGTSLTFGIEGVGTVIVFVLVFIMLVVVLELGIAIIKRLLSFRRWRVL